MINIESLREIQQVSAYNLTADVPLFKLSNVHCLMAGFAILIEWNPGAVKPSIPKNQPKRNKQKKQPGEYAYQSNRNVSRKIFPVKCK